MIYSCSIVNQNMLWTAYGSRQPGEILGGMRLSLTWTTQLHITKAFNNRVDRYSRASFAAYGDCPAYPRLFAWKPFLAV